MRIHEPAHKISKFVLLIITKKRKLSLETLNAAKSVLVNKWNKAIQLQQGILQRRSRQQKFVAIPQGITDSPGSHAVGHIYIAEFVGFINNTYIPINFLDKFRFDIGEFMWNDYNLIRKERIFLSLRQFLKLSPFKIRVGK